MARAVLVARRMTTPSGNSYESRPPGAAETLTHSESNKGRVAGPTCTSEHFAAIGELVCRGGPEEHEDAWFTHWLDSTSALVASGRMAREQVHRFWRECGANYLEGCLQGRALAKPFGYAGDFALIDDIYRETVAANTQLENWDRFFHRQAAPRAVRNRLGYFSALARSAVARATREAQILSLGCGPSRELVEFLRAQTSHEICITGIDRDPRALEHAARSLTAPDSRLELLQSDILRYVPEQRYDLIWAAGLFDYLPDKLFVRTLRRYGRALRPGGEIVIGNFRPDHSSQNYMELVGDWSVIYRTSGQLVRLALASGFPPGSFEVGQEPEGINLFLHVRPS